MGPQSSRRSRLSEALATLWTPRVLRLFEIRASAACRRTYTLESKPLQGFHFSNALRSRWLELLLEINLLFHCVVFGSCLYVIRTRIAFHSDPTILIIL